MDWSGRRPNTARRKMLPASMAWDCLHLQNYSGDSAAMQSAWVDGRCPGEIAGGRSLTRNGAAAGVVCLRWYGQRCGANWEMVADFRQLRIATECHLVC